MKIIKEDFESVPFLYIMIIVIFGFLFCALALATIDMILNYNVNREKLKNSNQPRTESEKAELSNISRSSLDAKGRAGAFSGWSMGPKGAGTPSPPQTMATRINLHVSLANGMPWESTGLAEPKQGSLGERAYNTRVIGKIRRIK